MPLVEIDAVDDPLDCLVERSVVEDDVRGLAAELERELLPGSRELALDRLADLGRTGEGDLVDALRLYERSARPSVTGDDVHDTGRKLGLPQHVGEQQRGQRVVSAGLSTTVLPAASAGAIFQASISSGKFHGMI